MDQFRYSVVVGNIGAVYDGYDYDEAKQHYDAYVGLSKAHYGRAADESVVLFAGEHIELEHPSTLPQE